MEFQKEFKNFSFGFSSGKVVGGGSKPAKYREILVDGSSVLKGEASAYKGIGCISANNSSRLLLDYKALHPEVYHEILRLLFEKNYGAQLSHIKLELGADVNSSSGTEPATMRHENEAADVTRGAGFIFVADALKINPELTVDMLRWGEPAWVKNAFEESRERGFEARYKWYSETIRAAYERLGIRFTHVSCDANETGDADSDWIIYFAERLRSDKSLPYDCSEVKIVASDEVGTRTIAAKMVENKLLRDSVDIIGLHYTTFGDENTEKLFSQYGKEIWYSEGIAPLNVSRLAVKRDSSGISGRNGAVDMADRIINSWYNGRMTMYELQPAVSAYYPGSCYYPKHIVKANEPWSGHFELGSGFFAVMHFTRFSGENWHPAASACFGDGQENHYIENSTANFMTLMPEDGSEFTMHLTNNSNVSRRYRISFVNCRFTGRNVNFCETAAPKTGESFDSGWFRNKGSVRLGDEPLEITVKPSSILTVTTLHTDFARGTAGFRSAQPERSRLSLPYEEDFSYSAFGADFLAGRSGAPLFTTDQGGAFEIESSDGRNLLVQKITKSIIPSDWRFRGTPAPLTTLGDDCWANYSAQVSVRLEENSDDCCAGIGVRYNSAVACEETSDCGFAVKLYGGGRWELLFMDNVVESGSTDKIIKDGENLLAVTATGNLYTAYINGSLIGSYTEAEAMQASGRISLLSSHHRNAFSDLKVSPVPAMNAYADFADALCPEIRYFGNVTLRSTETYKFSNRTCAEITENSGFFLGYKGCGFALCGTCAEADITVELDGKVLSASKSVGGSKFKQAFYRHDSCAVGYHTLKVTVNSGKVALDGVCVYTDSKELVSLREPHISVKKDNKKGSSAVKAAAFAAAGAAAVLLLKKASKKKK